MEQKRIKLKQVLDTLPFTKENFELLKEELIEFAYPKSLAEEIEELMEENAQKYIKTEESRRQDQNFYNIQTYQNLYTVLPQE